MTSLLRRIPAVPGRACRSAGLLPRCSPRARRVATLSRTYDDAMQLLEQLQSNSIAKGLFNNASPASPSASASSPSSVPSPSPNDRAIPEMQAWLTKADIDTTTLPFRAIHIAGTKGKGTTATLAASVLRERCLTGLYTSPHLVSVRERIQIDGSRLSRALFARYFFEAWDAVGCAPEEDPGGGGLCNDGMVRPFYFRFLTILAFHVFMSEKIKDVVVECGIGGEYDATNVLPASAVSASVITHLELDHVAMLGDTLESIAWHKAGIFKPGVPAFTREHPAAVMDVLRARAEEKGAELIVVADSEAARWDARLAAGPFQKDNRALASAAANCHLYKRLTPLHHKALERTKEAMRGARIRGRAEILRRGDAVFVLDGAHTPESVGGIAKWFAGWDRRKEKRVAGMALKLGAEEPLMRSVFFHGKTDFLREQREAWVSDADWGKESERPRHVLVFNQQERDAQALLEALLRAVPEWTFDEAIFTRNEEDGEGRDQGVQEGLAEAMRWLAPGAKVSVCPNVGEALDKVRGMEGKTRVLVTGSMYLVGAVLKTIEGDVDKKRVDDNGGS